MRKVAVTGAAGHLGANLVRELLSKGYQVIALVRKSRRALEGLDVECRHGDVLDLDSLRATFNGVEQVYHLAAHVTIQEGEWNTLHAVNVEGTGNVLRACRSAGVSTLVHFSSIHALNLHTSGQWVTEDNPLVDDPKAGGYDRSKAQSERLVRANECPSLSTRVIYPTAVIGPHDYTASLTGQAIARMARGELPVLVSGGFDWVDARDVASGAVAAAEQGRDGDRFILSGHYVPVSQMARDIARIVGIPAPAMTVPRWLAGLGVPLIGAWSRLRGVEPLYTRDSLAALAGGDNISHALASEQLGYQPRPFSLSLRETLEAAGYGLARGPQDDDDN